MIIEMKNKDEFYKVFKKKQEVEVALSNIPIALEGQPAHIQFEIRLLEKAMEEELIALNIKLKTFEAKPENDGEKHSWLRRNKNKKYQEIEDSDIPLTELNKRVQ